MACDSVHHAIKTELNSIKDKPDCKTIDGREVSVDYCNPSSCCSGRNICGWFSKNLRDNGLIMFVSTIVASFFAFIYLCYNLNGSK